MYSSSVRVNQVGYLRAATKVGVIVSSASTPLEWQVQDDSGSVVLSGSTTPFGFDEASGDNVHQADFSQIEQLGSFRLVVDGIGSSLTFSIAPSLYPDLPHEVSAFHCIHKPSCLITYSETMLPLNSGYELLLLPPHGARQYLGRAFD